jgi:hypothetical protein
MNAALSSIKTVRVAPSSLMISQTRLPPFALTEIALSAVLTGFQGNFE